MRSPADTAICLLCLLVFIAEGSLINKKNATSTTECPIDLIPSFHLPSPISPEALLVGSHDGVQVTLDELNSAYSERIHKRPLTSESAEAHLTAPTVEAAASSFIDHSDLRETLKAKDDMLQKNAATFTKLQRVISDQSKVILQIVNIRNGAMIPQDLNLYNPGTTQLNTALRDEMVQQMSKAWNNIPAITELFTHWATRNGAPRVSPLSFVNIPEGSVSMLCSPEQAYGVASLIFGQPDQSLHEAARSRIGAQLLVLSEHIAKGFEKDTKLSLSSQRLIAAMGGIDIPANIPLVPGGSSCLISDFFPDAPVHVFEKPTIESNTSSSFLAFAQADAVTKAYENITGEIFKVEELLNKTNTTTTNWFYDLLPDSREIMDKMFSGMRDLFAENPSITAVLSLSVLLLLWFGYQGGMSDPQRNMFLKTTTHSMTVTMTLTGLLIVPHYSLFVVTLAALGSIAHIFSRGFRGAFEVGAGVFGTMAIGGFAQYLNYTAGLSYSTSIATFGMLVQVQPTLVALRQIKEIAQTRCGGIVKGLYANAGPAGLTQPPPFTVRTPEQAREAKRRIEELVARARVAPAVAPQQRSRVVENNAPLTLWTPRFDLTPPLVVTAPAPWATFVDPSQRTQSALEKKNLEMARQFIYDTRDPRAKV
jgi:hypothetical protein